MSKKKVTHKTEKRKTKTDLINTVVNFFNRNSTESFSFKQVAEKLGYKKPAEKQLINNILFDLQEDAFIIETARGKFKSNNRGLFLEGVFERRSNGKNFFNADGEDEETSHIFVAERNSAHAMNGDRVKVQMLAKRKGRDPEAEVVEILERKQNTFVGTLDVQKQFAFLVMDSKILANDIFIPKDELHGGKDGDKALVEVVEWPKKAKNPIGKVIDILGQAGENNTEMNAILAEYGLPYKYPERVEEAANKISDEITKEEIAKREDMRATTTFTIDPRDAKDFDDALSVKQLKKGLWEVGVHIADVTHYVEEGDIIDKEGESRATSIYLVDRTIPMLPERLSNNLCSLRPHEDKLCYSVIFDIDDEANIKKYRIARTVIHSDRRFTYEEAQDIIETGEGDFKEEVLKLNDLAKKLRDKRFDSGAIAFDRHEVRFEIDEKGKPLSVYFKYAKESNKLIEEFMLLANRTVAEFVGKVPKSKTAKTFVYRIHDLPNSEKMENLSEFIRRFGYKIKVDGSKTAVSKSINHLLDEVGGTPEENLISTIAIRAMAKAIYSTANIGHYGLAFEYYTHFTSPIRRYPDMMVHRLLTKYMSGERSVSKQIYESKCEHSSSMEQLAANAERASIKYKQVEYMSDKLGQVFDAVISGITEWGLYAEINENKCEGMIPIRDLDDDFYEFDEKNYCLRGRRNKRTYSLGDPLKIKVAKANLERKQLDFALVEE
ncbi:ribonuclease R [Dysgonomonas sp. PFB1-18]|uniref:ribonuclease R n=1 Tax=unclassified Dysgonomonas TaxID=2630389 RepID=UPI00247553DF|nr:MULTISPECIES: ribonuclease R [unclassified Dysgonomonas]MDH6310743.1 ribonuclease R [Dysgonomonas sp. PF1-14]MDH6340593.1 ribonuclease R [Dysgonomonas sp. PF1-16]MDH6382150.1 ribonuclease R [Dysgonomonas sp. PFB1-18]MDH6399494.1 ribonuclease R [Dysgonomonas sp. PF1-23]